MSNQNPAQLTSMFIQQLKTISDSNPYSVDSQVNALLKDGWVPHGASFGAGDKIVVQMVKVDPRILDMANQSVDMLVEQLAMLRR